MRALSQASRFGRSPWTAGNRPSVWDVAHGPDRATERRGIYPRKERRSGGNARLGRWRRRNQQCDRRIFAERVPGFTAPVRPPNRPPRGKSFGCLAMALAAGPRSDRSDGSECRSATRRPWPADEAQQSSARREHRELRYGLNHWDGLVRFLDAAASSWTRTSSSAASARYLSGGGRLFKVGSRAILRS